MEGSLTLFQNWDIIDIGPIIICIRRSPVLPNVRKIMGRFPRKPLLAVVLALGFVVSVFVGVSAYSALTKEVVVVQDGKSYSFKTLTDTVGKMLQQKGFNLTSTDFVNLALDTKLLRTKINEIHIRKAVPITVAVDGKNINMMTAYPTVSEAMSHGPIQLSSLDKFDGTDPNAKVIPGMKVKIIRVTEQMVTKQESIPYTTKRIENHKLAKGEEKTVKRGADGIIERTIKVVMEDGRAVARKVATESVLLLPVNRIVEYGTTMKYITSRGSEIRYNKVLRMDSTAYTASYEDTGKRPGDRGFGVTATGAHVKKGIIAVDPSVIPLGTRVYIESEPDYGYAVAADTGGAIKGNIIDVYVEGSNAAKNWGRRKVKVYILD